MAKLKTMEAEDVKVKNVAEEEKPPLLTGKKKKCRGRTKPKNVVCVENSSGDVVRVSRERAAFLVESGSAKYVSRTRWREVNRNVEVKPLPEKKKKVPSANKGKKAQKVEKVEEKVE